MCLEKIQELKEPIAIAIVAIIITIALILTLGNSPEAFIAIATIFLVLATIYIANFNRKLWIAQDKPYLHFILTDWYKDVKNARFGVYVKNIGKGPAKDIKFEVVGKKYSPVSLAPMEKLPIREISDDEREDGVQITNIYCKDTNEIQHKQKGITLTPVFYEPKQTD